jgi:hypothetical protein
MGLCLRGGGMLKHFLLIPIVVLIGCSNPVKFESEPAQSNNNITSLQYSGGNLAPDTVQITLPPPPPPIPAHR